jgi:hypothetical protein
MCMLGLHFDINYKFDIYSACMLESLLLFFVYVDSIFVVSYFFL